jgi:hypothetical protein
MTTINLSTFAVRDDSGDVDVDATCEKFAQVLLQYQAERETESATIGAAVNAVFDQHRGATINTPAITSLVLQRLNAQFEQYKVLSERVHSYIRSNAGEKGSALFRVAKGKGGGVSRWSDAK